MPWNQYGAQHLLSSLEILVELFPFFFWKFGCLALETPSPSEYLMTFHGVGIFPGGTLCILCLPPLP